MSLPLGSATVAVGRAVDQPHLVLMVVGPFLTAGGLVGGEMLAPDSVTVWLSLEDARRLRAELDAAIAEAERAPSS